MPAGAAPPPVRQRNAVDERRPGAGVPRPRARRRPACSAASRQADDGDLYWRITQYLLPNHSLAPGSAPGDIYFGQTWVPIDDHSCWIYVYSWNPERPLTEQEDRFIPGVPSVHAEVDEHWVPIRNRSNDYLIDREAQRTRSFTGIEGISEQDAAIQDSQGFIADRTREHLGPTDLGIVRFRRCVLDAAKALAAGRRAAGRGRAGGLRGPRRRDRHARRPGGPRRAASPLRRAAQHRRLDRVAMAWTPDPDALRGRVAVVAGSTRGAGRGIAAALGECGATVVCTGRSTRAEGSTRSDYDRPETIEETAELVTSLGGTGVPIAVDHLEPDRGRRASPTASARDHGAIDVLVNDIWGAEVLKGGPAGVEHADLGARPRHRAAHRPPRRRDPPVTSHHLLPLLVQRPGGLLDRGHRRHRRLQRRPLPHLGVLRPRQDDRHPARLLHGPRPGAVRRHGGGGHAGVPALGDDARQLRRHRGDVAHGAAPPGSPCRRRRASSAGPSPPSPPIQIAAAGTNARRRRPSWRRVRLHRRRRPRPDVWGFDAAVEAGETPIPPLPLTNPSVSPHASLRPLW